MISSGNSLGGLENYTFEVKERHTEGQDFNTIRSFYAFPLKDLQKQFYVTSII
jgi:hypothetical protein